MKVAYLCTNPTEHLIEGAPLLFEEVQVSKINQALKYARIIKKGGCVERVGWIWLFQDWAKGIEEIEMLKIRLNEETKIKCL